VDLTLDFKMFETAVLFVSIFVVNSLIQDSRTHWLEGWMLLGTF
jgi:Ca2+:H+ antiporter